VWHNACNDYFILFKFLAMETGILRELFDELLIKSPQGVYGLCKGSEDAIRIKKEKYIGQQVRFYLLPSNKAVCIYR
jgi:hypothetical protein